MAGCIATVGSVRWSAPRGMLLFARNQEQSMVKLQLIHPGNDPEYASVATGYCHNPPPMGLESLAVYAESRVRNLQTEIWDGRVTPIDQIVDSLDADIIGISDWFTNHRTALYLAEAAKSANPDCVILLGGPNATNLAPRILRNRPFVDYVVAGDGEEALASLLAGRGPQATPNVYCRSPDGSVGLTRRSHTNLDDIPPLSLEHLAGGALGRYDSRLFSKAFEADIAPLPVSNVRGCVKAMASGRCSYCSVGEPTARMRSPRKAWEEFLALQERYGISNFFETGDILPVEYARALLDSKPGGTSIGLRIYSQPGFLTQKDAHMLASLGVQEVFYGIESTSHRVRRAANRSELPQDTDRVIETLGIAGIGVFVPFILGLPGETVQSAKEAADLARRLAREHDNVRRFLFSLAVPLAGTAWFENLTENEDLVADYNSGGRDLLVDDDIDYARLTRLAIENCCEASPEELCRIVLDCRSSLGESRIGGFGCLEEKIIADQVAVVPKTNAPVLTARNS